MEKLLVLMALLVSGLAWNAACAQVGGNRLSGKVLSSTNTSIPNVSLTLKNTSNGHIQVLTVVYNTQPLLRNLRDHRFGCRIRTGEDCSDDSPRR